LAGSCRKLNKQSKSFIVPYLFIEIARAFENLLSLVDVALFQFIFSPPKRTTSEVSVSPFGSMVSPDEETAQIYQAISASGMMNFDVLYPSVSMQHCP
jgi:hypothetical protein